MTLPLAALPLGPSFTARPACAGRHPLFDAHVDRETEGQRIDRHAYAVAICGYCPARPECEVLVVEDGHRLRGVWAGVLLGSTK
jgi:hypothetical protein